MELAIVISVIAILAIVVVFGRGYVDASRAANMRDALGVIQRAVAEIAAEKGGCLPTSILTEMPELHSRGVIPNDMVWTVTGNHKIERVVWECVGGQNRVAIALRTGNSIEMAVLVWEQARIQLNYIPDSTLNLAAWGVCAGNVQPPDDTPIFCFNVN